MHSRTLIAHSLRRNLKGLRWIVARCSLTIWLDPRENERTHCARPAWIYIYSSVYWIKFVRNTFSLLFRDSAAARKGRIDATIYFQTCSSPLYVYITATSCKHAHVKYARKTVNKTLMSDDILYNIFVGELNGKTRTCFLKYREKNRERCK